MRTEDFPQITNQDLNPVELKSFYKDTKNERNNIKFTQIFQASAKQNRTQNKNFECGDDINCKSLILLFGGYAFYWDLAAEGFA